MAIKEITGNVIGLAETGELHGLAHGCNCMHAMGSGIAGQLARRYPAVPQVDRDKTICGDKGKLGTYTDVCLQSVVAEEVYFNVFNMYTQYAPSYDGSDVFEYEKFAEGCIDLRNELEDEWGLVDDDETYKLGFPQIGAGLAGGDWPSIRDAIIAAFATSNIIDVYLVEWDGSDLPSVEEVAAGIKY